MRFQHNFIKDVLHFPKKLNHIYKHTLQHRGWLGKALGPAPKIKGNIGGVSDSDTEDHFCFRFLNSSSRIVYLFTNPDGHFDDISQKILTAMMFGNIALLDIPSGTGPAHLSIISLLMEMREAALIPRAPSKMTFFCGEIAASARDIAKQMQAELIAQLRNSPISLSFFNEHWDAADVTSTVSLIDKWFIAVQKDFEFFVIISNFSGEINAEASEKFRRTFEHLSERLHDKKFTILWVEPRPRETFLKKLAGFFTGFWIKQETERPVIRTFNWHDPLRNSTVPGTVAVKLYGRS